MAPATKPTDRSASSYVRSFNRFEYKYLVPHVQARAFLSSLAPFTRPDPHDPALHGYAVHSVYWDSPELVFFWEKIDGVKYRRKLRFRHYGNDVAPSGDLFCEIKQRTDRTIQKRRVKLSLARVRDLFEEAEARPEVASEVGDTPDPVLQEALLLVHQYRLQPTAAVSYRRRALFGLHEPGLRITLDTALQYDTTRPEAGKSLSEGRTLLDPRVGVLEIKFDERVPLWLVRLAEGHGLELVRFSKYCAAVDRAHFGGRYL